MTIKIALYKGTQAGIAGLYNRAVRAWTLGPYSHCALIAEEHANGDVTIWHASWADGGVRQKTIRLDPAKWDVIEVDGNLARAVAWFEAHAGEGYDILGNFGFILRPIADDRDKWFCSEAILEAMGQREAWRFDPNSLAAIVVDPVGFDTQQCQRSR